VAKLALKVDADTLVGTQIGVPRLLKILEKHRAGATFLFSLGPDHTGRAIKRVFRRGFLQKVNRTSVVEHYGIKTLLYGTLLPGPDIGKRCAQAMRAVRDAGFEVGIHCYDHVKWQDHVIGADRAWTEHEMSAAVTRFEEVFGARAKTHGAAGWQMNTHALRLTQQFGFDYCSDSRGRYPFLPQDDNDLIACPQLPTTLPTLDELLGRDAMGPDAVVDHLLRLTAQPPAQGHVFTLHAELEGQRLAPLFERLLAGWRQQGYALTSLQDYFADFAHAVLPRCEVHLGSVEGRSGTLLCQGAEIAEPGDSASMPPPP
jgi:undecaprenyl phosphate-alpha-L-ara4FN deformylase